MNPIAEEISSYLGSADMSDEDFLAHYGMPRRSGRYPWGSGEDPYQHGSKDFIGRVDELRKSGFEYTDEKGKKWTGDTAIAKSMGLTTSQFRTEITLAKNERRMLNVATAKSLKADGLGDSEIGRKMGVNESTVRSWLNTKSEARMNEAQKTADFLKERLKEYDMIDVGGGAELDLGVSRTKLDQALYLLEREGYSVYKGGIPQATNQGQQTNQTVLCKPGVEHKEIYEFDRIGSIKEYSSHDGGETFDKFVYPKSMDSKRLMIRYAEDGGIEKDGVIELRRGCEDLSLGESRYSQVRILVDDSKYLKGMAVYSDDMPPGVDVIFNTNKNKSVAKMDVLKDIKKDPDNPFGSLIQPKGQSYYINKDGKKQLSLINKRADEGDWSEWADALPSQFLGKQPIHMAKKQLDLARADREAEFDDICALTNPTIKKHFLDKFASSCDSAAVDLKAAALPGQKYHVIIPFPTLKETEVYAPLYENGTKLALVRYPHGGIFEIPILTVNNKHKPARDLLGTVPSDAVGINSKVAERLSGADFDGDTVMCIPTHDSGGKVKISSKPPLKGLEGFDSKIYQYDTKTKDEDGTEHYFRNGVEFRIMRNTGNQMGRVSNLITDMTLAGATDDELARAVRHSMVVIDAEKHKLDFKQSEIDNDIPALQKKYQAKRDAEGNIIDYGGASTLLSKSKGETSVLKRQGAPRINQKGKEWYDPSKPEGALIYKTAKDLYYPIRKHDKKTGIMTIRTVDGKSVKYDISDEEARQRYSPVKREDPDGTVRYTDSTGTIEYKIKARTQPSTKMAEAENAYDIMSSDRHPMEILYADYANNMKALANKARKELAYTGKIAYDAKAKSTYSEEVVSLENKLKAALSNRTREREAQRRANAEIKAKKALDPDMTKGDEKKLSQQALTKYRSEVGSISRRDRNIEITDREWEAIQAGAISETKLKQILDNTDIDALRERAMPRVTSTLSEAKVNRIKALSESNYTLSEIAKKLGVSESAVSKHLKGVKKTS